MSDTARMLADTTARLLDRAIERGGMQDAMLLERFREAGPRASVGAGGSRRYGLQPH